MAEDQAGTPAGEDGIPKHTPGGTGEMTPRQLANSLTDWQHKQRAAASAPPKESVSQPVAAPEAPAADEPTDTETGSPDGVTTDEGQEQAPDSEVPTIDPPSSWTKDAQERWSKLDRETQEYLAARDREDNAAIKRKFQEAEETTKKQLEGLTAREQAMEQARLQFETMNQAMLQEYMATLQGEFADIQSMADVERLANDDWARYNRWQVHQTKIAAKKAQVDADALRQMQETQSKFTKFADEQDKAFVARVPEFANKEKAAELQSAAVKTLKNVGFTEDELTKHWNSMNSLSLREGKVQELIHKAARWDSAQEAKKTVAAKKDLPPVQRPGVAQPSNSSESQIRNLQKQAAREKGRTQLETLAQIQTLRQQSAMRSR